MSCIVDKRREDNRIRENCGSTRKLFSFFFASVYVKSASPESFQYMTISAFK